MGVSERERREQTTIHTFHTGRLAPNPPPLHLMPPAMHTPTTPSTSAAAKAARCDSARVKREREKKDRSLSIGAPRRPLSRSLTRSLALSPHTPLSTPAGPPSPPRAGPCCWPSSRAWSPWVAAPWRPRPHPRTRRQVRPRRPRPTLSRWPSWRGRTMASPAPGCPIS